MATKTRNERRLLPDGVVRIRVPVTDGTEPGQRRTTRQLVSLSVLVLERSFKG